VASYVPRAEGHRAPISAGHRTRGGSRAPQIPESGGRLEGIRVCRGHPRLSLVPVAVLRRSASPSRSRSCAPLAPARLCDDVLEPTATARVAVTIYNRVPNRTADTPGSCRPTLRYHPRWLMQRPRPHHLPAHHLRWWAPLRPPRVQRLPSPALPKGRVPLLTRTALSTLLARPMGPLLGPSRRPSSSGACAVSAPSASVHSP